MLEAVLILFGVSFCTGAIVVLLFQVANETQEES